MKFLDFDKKKNPLRGIVAHKYFLRCSEIRFSKIKVNFVLCMERREIHETLKIVRKFIRKIANNTHAQNA